MMATRKLRIVNDLGLHLRAEGLFAKTAGGFDAKIEVRCGGEAVDGTDVTGLLSLSCAKGAFIEVAAYGPEGEDAAQGLLEKLMSFKTAREVEGHLMGVLTDQYTEDFLRDRATDG